MVSTKTALSKSDFIRSQPATLSAAEVVAKGKAAGLTILPGLVYEVRRTAKAKKGTAQKASGKPTVAAKSPRAANKADFVRAHADLSPKEVVAKAKEGGIKFEVGYVYNVRGYDKMAKRKRAARKTSTPAAANGRRPSMTTSSAENLLKALGAELGLGRAMGILAEERARIMAVLGE